MSIEKVECTLSDMIDRDLLNTGLGTPQKYLGFTLGERGKTMFWHICPTSNGYYKIYPQFENGELGKPRYVDGCKQKVKVHPVNHP